MARPKKPKFLENFKLHFTYNKIYLVADEGSNGTSVRVTNKDEYGRPGTVHFSGRRPDHEGKPVGTLVIDEDLWETWFGHRTNKIPHMDTAEKAAAYMVNPNQALKKAGIKVREPLPATKVYYGCPVCTFRTKDYDEYRKHVSQKGEWILGQFDVQVEILPDAPEEVESEE